MKIDTLVDALKAQVDQEATKLKALVRERQVIERQIEAVRHRMEAFQQSLAIATSEPVPAISFLDDGTMVTASGVVRPTIHHPDPWEDALRVMKERTAEFTTDALLAEARARGSDIKRDRVRSRLAHMVDKKKLIRIREGWFTFPPDVRASESSEEDDLLEAARALAWRDEEPG
jgi:cell division septum initiation protein DivIVA